MTIAINPVKIQTMNNELNHFGLNLFVGTEMAKLPAEITQFFIDQQITYDKADMLYLLANGGADLWNHLPHPLSPEDHPIDLFSIEQIKKIDPAARILFPHTKWNIPLQRIGRFLNLSRPSLLGLDINDEFGLWFAFRGAFLSTLKIETKTRASFNSPCLSCQERPCLSACPAQAVAEDSHFKLNLCADYRLSANSNCSDRCLARLACPYQKDKQYKMEQLNYHMSSIAHLKRLSDHTS